MTTGDPLSWLRYWGRPRTWSRAWPALRAWFRVRVLWRLAAKALRRPRYPFDNLALNRKAARR